MAITKDKKKSSSKSKPKHASSSSASSSSSSSDDSRTKKKSSSKDKSKAKKKKTEAATFVVEQEFRGSKTLGIFEGEEGDDTEGKFPVIAFGLKKAKAIVKHLDEIKVWIEEQE